MQINVKDHGAVGNGTSPDAAAIARAMAAVVASGGGTLFFPPGTYRVDRDLTISDAVAVELEPGGKLSMDSGVTLTINGPRIVGMHEMFTGAGSVTIGMKVLDIYDAWFGDDIARAVAATSAGKQKVHVTQPTLSRRHTITKSCILVFDTDVTCSVNRDWQLAFEGVASGQPNYTLTAVYDPGTRVVTLTDAGGLAPGQYLRMTAVLAGITTYSHYIVERVSGNTVTLNRGLDTRNTTGANTVTRYTPISVHIDGQGHTMTMTADEPGFAILTHCAHSSVRNLTVVCKGNYDPATRPSAVRNIIRANFSYDVSVRDLSMRGLKGGDQFGYVAASCCTGITVRGVAILDSAGWTRGLECFNSTHVLFDGNRLHQIGTPVGAIHANDSYFVDVVGNEIKDAFGTTSSGIQATYCSHVKIVANSVHNAQGAGHVYVNSGAGIQISGNLLTQTLGGSNAHFVVVRTGDGITVTGNTCVGKAAGIRFRQASNFVCSGNTVTGDISAFGIACALLPGDSARSCRNGIIEGNTINVDSTQRGDLAGIFLGPAAGEQIFVKNNLLRMKTTATGGSMSGIAIYLSDPASVVAGNVVHWVSGPASPPGFAYGIYVNNSATRVEDNQLVGRGLTTVGSCPNVEKIFASNPAPLIQALANGASWDFWTPNAPGTYLVSVVTPLPGAGGAVLAYVWIELNGKARIATLHSSGNGLTVTNPSGTTLRLTNAMGGARDFIASVTRIS